MSYQLVGHQGDAPPLANNQQLRPKSQRAYRRILLALWCGLMPKKRLAKRQRGASSFKPPWRESLSLDRLEYGPKGDDESLQLALKILGLEGSELETARQEISDAAIKYNNMAAVAASAPRKKEVEKRLRALRDAYGTVSKLLLHIDSETLNEIHDVRARGHWLYRIARADFLAEFESRPEIVNGELEFESPLVRAEAMRVYLDHVIAVFHRCQNTKRKAVDVGGKANVFRSRYGHEKLDLVRECAGLFDKYGLGKRITSTASGDFFSFVSHVYDFAVGDESSGEGRGLAHPIKEIVREYKRQMAENDQLIAKWRW
jgi:hypothetical protein